jgi:uncharacterized protein YegL
MRSNRFTSLKLALVFLPVVLFVGSSLFSTGAQGEQGAATSAYDLTVKPVSSEVKTEDGLNTRWVKQEIAVTRRDKVLDPDGKYEVVVYELGREVLREKLPNAGAGDELAVVLAIDIGKSMEKLVQETKAAVENLPLAPSAQVGSILFRDNMTDNSVRKIGEKSRAEIVAELADIGRSGGSAPVDAALEGIKMLSEVSHDNRVLVLFSRGRDRSEYELPAVVEAARKNKVKIYTIGLGEPARHERMWGVLVLDNSGSMKDKADVVAQNTRLDAMQSAARRILAAVPQSKAAPVQLSLMSFNETVTVPTPFTNKRDQMQKVIDELQPTGTTAFLDALYEAICTLEARAILEEKSIRAGQRELKDLRLAVIGISDGIDNNSRHDMKDVIERATGALKPIAVHLVRVGRADRMAESIMSKLAKDTKGSFYNVASGDYVEVVEGLTSSEGINENLLQDLAVGTGGRYFPAKGVEQLAPLLAKSTGAPAFKGTLTFPGEFKSLLQTDTGTARWVTVKLLRDGVEVQKKEDLYTVHGLVVPEINHFVYLGLLIFLGVLLALPAGLRRLRQTEG